MTTISIEYSVSAENITTIKNEMRKRRVFVKVGNGYVEVTKKEVIKAVERRKAECGFVGVLAKAKDSHLFITLIS